VSTQLFVRSPGREFVAEDHIWALRVHVHEVALETADIARRVSHHASQLADDPWSHTPVSDLVSVAHDIAGLARDATWLASALDRYGRDIARQEAARVRVFGAPAERLLAIGLIAAVDLGAVIDVGDADISRAASVFLGDEFASDDVSVWQVLGASELLVTQAGSVEERIGRIPAEGAPIRIERYDSGDGDVQTEVFIAGTKDWGLGSTAEPFDLESNLALVAGVTASSLVAVEMAMRRAGVQPGDRVTFVGHSQGGLVATRLAESGRYQTTGLVTAGAPLGSSPVTGNYPALVISHSDDVVPALAGYTEHEAGWHFERHSGGRFGDVAGAHSLEAYVETGRVMDRSQASQQWGDWSGSGQTTIAALYDSQRKAGG